MAVNLEGVLVNIISFGRNYPLPALIIAVALFLLIVLRPKLFLSFFLLALILSGIFYLILDTGSSASKVKQNLIHKSEESAK